MGVFTHAKKYVAVVLSLCMVLSAMTCLTKADFASAKAKPSVSKKTVSLKVGKSIKVKLKNAKGYKATWKSSSKKIATVKKSGASAAKITAKKVGKATVKATLKKGKKKVVLSVKVKVSANKAASTETKTTQAPATKGPQSEPTKAPEATSTPVPTDGPTATPQGHQYKDYLKLSLTEDMLMASKSISDIKYNSDGSITVTISSSEKNGGFAFYIDSSKLPVDMSKYRRIIVDMNSSNSVTAAISQFSTTEYDSCESVWDASIKKNQAVNEYATHVGECYGVGITIPNASKDITFTINSITLKGDLRNSEGALKLDSLAKLSEQYGFKFGTVLSYYTLNDKPFCDIMKHHFNTLTASNEFKAYSMLDAKTSKANKDEQRAAIDFTQADAIMDFAKENKIAIRGHNLVWYASMVDWFFREGFDPEKEYASQEVCRARVKNYIEDVLTHFETKYPDVIYCWDCVNEAVDESGRADDPRGVRKPGADLFAKNVGSDYVEYAFKCANDCLVTLGRRDKVKLVYNDFNAYEPTKAGCISELVKSINSYDGDKKLCDVVGLQGYVGGYGKQEGCMNSNDLTKLFNAMKGYADLGVDVQITEMAIRNFENGDSVMESHANFYKDFMKKLIEFNTSDKYKGKFTSLSIWGITDDPTLRDGYSFKQNGPYCGLFDEDYNPKQSMLKVIEALKGE